MKFKRTLGIYEGFPNVYHGIARFEFNTFLDELQIAILNSIYKLNGKQVNSNLATLVGSDNVEIIFEAGVADGLTFNYIDNEELKILIEEVNKEPFNTLDLFCIIRYYALKEGKRRALRFDYYFLRFLFGSREFEIQVFHEKGLQRISVKELIKFLIKKINLELAKSKKGFIKIRYLKTW